MAHAAIDNPTKCIVLEIDSAFQAQFYEDLQFKKDTGIKLYEDVADEDIYHFMSNDQNIIENVTRIYELRVKEDSPSNQVICTYYIKELLLRLYQTKALTLLKDSFEEKVVDHEIQKAISYMKGNLNNKLTLKELADISGLGLTTFNNKFKATTGLTAFEYLLNDRIRHAKILLLKNQMSLKEVAFNSGFNSYEYFCSSFKKIEGIKPSEFKKSKLLVQVS